MRQKPTPGSTFNAAHPLSQGLVVACPCNDRSGQTFWNGTGLGNVDMVGYANTVWGPEDFRGAGATSYPKITKGALWRDAFFKKPHTFFADFYCTDRYGWMLGKTGVYYISLVGVDSTYDKVRFQRVGAPDGMTEHQIPKAVGNRITLVCVNPTDNDATPANTRVLRNGIFYPQTYNATGSGFYGPGTNSDATLFTSTYGLKLYGFSVWNRALSVDEMEAVYADPWAMFKEARNREYFFVSALYAVAATGNNVTAASTIDNLTSSATVAQLLRSSSTANIDPLISNGAAIQAGNHVSTNSDIANLTSSASVVQPSRVTAGSTIDVPTSSGQVAQLLRSSSTATVDPLISTATVKALANSNIVNAASQVDPLVSGGTVNQFLRSSATSTINPFISSASVVQATEVHVLASSLISNLVSAGLAIPGNTDLNYYRRFLLDL